MKKIILTVVMMITLFSSIPYANANSSSRVTMLMDGKNVALNVVNLRVFGKPMETDVPPVLYNDRTLVPVRFVAESMGAEVEWNQGQYTATITTENKEILLKVDSPVAIINGEEKRLPDGVAPKIITYKGKGRTMVPLRFVAEVLGLEVNWENHTRTVVIDHKKANSNEGTVKDIRFTTEAGFPQIRINTGRAVDHEVLKLSGPNRLVFDFHNTKFDLKENVLHQSIKQEGVINLRASQFKTNPLVTRLVLELEEFKDYEVSYNQNSGEMIISFINQSNTDSKKPEILVVIDPGHGGVDPGAISPIKGLLEKEIALDVSHRLNKLLKEAGFKTYMTRERDVTVSLADRVTVANQMGADLFVSVHANAALTPNAHGVEHLYYPSEGNPQDHRGNRRLAQIFQNQMIQMTGARDRGVVPRENLYVLRETKMPAILSEIGFLTNPKEEEKLATQEYRQLAAEAMFRSIVMYFQ
ncbi:N-acetylmuramoyl-L-alanine amidase [Alkaliphilus metalliredigens QYMF]|uniref:N-acetylmuramoyl-L-alanine amidase n=1 Tax=Alkaliphilus metalliredigens (strain QYMF) TaxID=293826 RepID=A6TPD3_ALKMQ|nr:N-acetylmuramoyl-L-alanine amidase family protein [Alkaliphilus metalliredigens]ABR48051.1 N-acetylmuramoyl-L-alanine amidase [Alkaliphilus metalliredigens QYMF]